MNFKKTALFCLTICLGIMTNAQIKISGIVKDQFGEPLSGAGITVSGTLTGTIADVDGKYELSVKDESVVLEYSFFGMITKSVKVGSQRIINVTLEEDTIGLEETIVIGYGTIKKEEITTSIVRVKQDNFTKGGVNSPYQLLQGKVAGLGMSNTSGDPSSSPSISLRGISTLAASSAPLVVIDGIAGGSINSVAPEDIESIDVLKDGSAAAIYGTRGTNGVIIITTKRGGDGQAQIDYEGYVKFDSMLKDDQTLSASQWRKEMSNPDIASTLERAGIVPQDYGANSDWVGAITRNPVNTNHYLSLKGGNKDTHYVSSITYGDKQGIYNNSYDNSLALKFRVDHSMWDGKLKAELNLNDKIVTQGYVSNELYDNASKWNPTFPMYQEDGKTYYMTNAETPICTANEWKGVNKYNQLSCSGKLLLRPIEGLTLSVTGAYQNDYNENEWWGSHKTYEAVYGGKEGYAKLSGGHGNDVTLEIQGDYTKTIGDHNIMTTAGYSYNRYIYQNWSMEGYGFPVDGFGVWNIGTANSTLEGLSKLNSNKWERKLIGFYGRFNYSYANKYLLMASIRREGSDKFGQNNRWGWFPSVSAGWRISREDFMKNIPWINELKLRVGFGVTGTEPSSAYQYIALYNFNNAYMSYVDGKWINGIVPANNPNPNLKWEEKQETNIGIDYAFLDSRIYGAIDGYYRYTKDLLYTYTVPTPPNITNSMLANVGSLENKGVELSINFDVIRNKNFNWTIGGNLSYNSNKLISLSNDTYQLEYLKLGNMAHVQTYSHRVDPNEPIGNFYGWKQDGLKGGGSSWRIVGAENSAAGEEQKHILGNGIPKMFAAFYTNLSYNNFDLNISFHGAFLYQILNQYRMMYETLAWVQTYNVPRSTYQKIGNFYNYAPSTYCDYYIENGDYMKLDNLTLSYRFNCEKFKYLRNMKVYVSGRNLLTFTSYKGLDPEAVDITGLTPGVDNLTKYPTSRSVTIGVNVSF